MIVLLLVMLAGCDAEAPKEACTVEVSYTATDADEAPWPEWSETWEFDAAGHTLRHDLQMGEDTGFERQWEWEAGCNTRWASTEGIYTTVYEWTCGQPGVWNSELMSRGSDDQLEIEYDVPVDSALDETGHPRLMTASDGGHVYWIEAQTWSTQGLVWSDRRVDGDAVEETHALAYDHAGRLILDVGVADGDESFRYSWSYDERGREIEREAEDAYGSFRQVFEYKDDEAAHPRSSVGTGYEGRSTWSFAGDWNWDCEEAK